MKTLLLTALLLATNALYAGRIRDIDFRIDTLAFGTKNTFTITVYLIKKNGKRIELKPNESSLYWSRISVKGEHILAFKHGLITFNQAQITKENNSIVLEVSYNQNEHSIQKPITFPYVKGMMIQNSTIAVNHAAAFDYQLLFSNGKTAPGHQKLFDANNFQTDTSPEVKLTGSTLMIQLDEPAAFETIDLSIKNRLTDEVLGSRTLLIAYPSSCRIDKFGNDGKSGKNGTDGKKTSENGTAGSNGESGTSGRDVRIFAKLVKSNNINYLVLHIFDAKNIAQSEVLQYNGQPIPVSTYGGRGGNGGNGGNGMNGLIDKEKQIDSPKGGNGGMAGNAGSGGNGGNVFLVYPSETGDISSVFSFETQAGGSGIAGTGGKGGKGDYSDSKTLGKVLTNKDGNDGTNGAAGSGGVSGQVKYPRILSLEEWTSFYQQHLLEGFVK
jgi:hypothetical protein